MADCNMQSMQRPRPGSCSRDQLLGMPLAIAYVPWQHWNETYQLDKAMQVGTIFPELDKPFLGKRGACR